MQASADLLEWDSMAKAKRSRDREATEGRLLEAAATVFAKRGYDAATTRDIANSAKVNEALISRYFGGKKGLLNAIMNQFTDHARDQLCLNSPLPATPRDELRAFFNHTAHSCPVTSQMVRVGLSRALNDPSAGGILREHFLTARVPSLLDRLSRISPATPKKKLAAAAEVAVSVAFSTAILGRILFGLSDNEIDRVCADTADLLATSLT